MKEAQLIQILFPMILKLLFISLLLLSTIVFQTRSGNGRLIVKSFLTLSEAMELDRRTGDAVSEHIKWVIFEGKIL